jgi:hypothetical protein
MHLLLAFVGLATGFVLPMFAQDTVDPKTAQQINSLATNFTEVSNKHDPTGRRRALHAGCGLGNVPRNILRSAAH